MKKIIYIVLLIVSSAYSQGFDMFLIASQQQYANETPPTPFEDYYNLTVDFGADTVSTFDKFTSWAGTDYNDWVHPSVLHFDTNWNGHPYWMAITGYGATQGANENPYLFYSDDGNTWLTMVGTPAPLHTSTSDGVTDTAYLSDTWLMYEGGIMYIFNRGNLTAGGSYFEYRSTTDGINFTARTRILRSGVAATTDYVSHSVILLGGTWYIFATDTADTGKLAVLSSTSVSGTFTEINRITSDSGALWHAEVHYNPDDTNFYVLGSTNGASGGDLMFGKFSDVNAVSMETRNTFLLARGLGVGRNFYYKSAFVIKDNAMELFLGTKGDAVNSATGWRVQKATTSRLTPTLNLAPYSLEYSYPFADVTNGFTSGLRSDDYNKMLLQFTIVDPKTFNVHLNRKSATSYLSLTMDGNTLYLVNWQSGAVAYDPITYGVKVDDVVTIIRNETDLIVYINGNLVYTLGLPTDTGYSGLLFGDFANNGSIKDLKVYKKPEWIYDTASYDTNISAMLSERTTNPLQYILADDFNRASLGTTDLSGNTYTIVGTPTITSNVALLSAGAWNILGKSHSETDYTIYVDGSILSGKVFLNYTDNNNCRYISLPDLGGEPMQMVTITGGSTSSVDFNLMQPTTFYGKWAFEIIADTTLKVYGDNLLIKEFTLSANADTKFIGFAAQYSVWVDDLIVRKTATVTPDTTAPTAPTSLVASNITDTTVDLVWTASTDNVAVTNYKVYNSGTLIATVGSATTSYTVTGLTPSTSYVLTVRGLDQSTNESTDSNSQSFTTDAPPSLPPYTYSDNFDDNSFNTSIWEKAGWAHASSSILEVNQQMELTAGASTQTYTELLYKNNYDMTGRQMWVELKQMFSQVTTNTTTWMGLYTVSEDNLNIEINAVGGIYRVICSKKVSTVYTSLSSIAYNSAVHKWFRIREASGTTYWEYSTDGFSWPVMHSETNPLAVTALQFRTGFDSYSPSTSQKFIIDNFYGF